MTEDARVSRLPALRDACFRAVFLQHSSESLFNKKEHGLAILLVEQNAQAALRIAHQGVVLETGQVRLRGHSSELLANPIIQAIYLGGKEYQSQTKTER